MRGSGQLGVAWRKGLPPGVYEDRHVAVAQLHVRMDVAAFVGLAERGPIDRAVTVESFDEYSTNFGAAGGGRLLGQSVYLFFANGGRRCVVVRVTAPQARPARWNVPTILSQETGAPLSLAARNPGAWGGRLRGRFEYVLRPLPVERAGADILLVDPTILVGTTIRRSRRQSTASSSSSSSSSSSCTSGAPADALAEEMGWVSSIQVLPNGKRLATIEGLTLLPSDEIGTLHEVRLEIELATPELRERFVDLALHPRHPRYVATVLTGDLAGTTSAGAGSRLVIPIGEPGRLVPLQGLLRSGVLEHVWSDKDQGFVATSTASVIVGTGSNAFTTQSGLGYSPGDRVRATSTAATCVDGRRVVPMLIVEGAVVSYDDAALVVNVDRIEGSGTSASWLLRDVNATGYDAAVETTRSHFFELAGGGSPLDLLDVYDDASETQPVSLICLPDLVHPSQVEAIVFDEDPAVSRNAHRFGVCIVAKSPPDLVPTADYPSLALSYDLVVAARGPRSALDWQAELVARCESLGAGGETDVSRGWGRIAVLDLPPGLDAAEILRWRRDVRSDLGCAALYAPYLRSAPAEDPLAPLLTVAPCGAAAGIIARREQARGVHVAPANELVQGIIALHEDGHLPDAGFLHEARVDLVRVTEQGFCLLGSRTTSEEPEWTHLSARRIVHWLERQLAIDTRWAVFEPNDRILWSRLARGVEQRLASLFAAGAFAGDTPATSYFVRCDARVNATAAEQGRVIVEVGVAPAVPAEFIVFELTQRVDGTSLVGERNG